MTYNRNRSNAQIAYAKLNLGLDILGRRGEWHVLETLVLPIDLGERVWVQPAEGVTLAYTDGRVYAADTALAAAQRYVALRGLPGARILIQKRIPEGWGLGGSSADAAAILRGLDALYQLQPLPPAEMLPYGADVAAQYAARPCVCRGRGECLTPVPFPALYVTIACRKGARVDTAAAYRLYDAVGGEHARIGTGLPVGKVPNALERAACNLQPAIAGVGEALMAAGFPIVSMTGSGAAYYGACPDAQTQENAKAHLQLPQDCDVLQGRTKESL